MKPLYTRLTCVHVGALAILALCAGCSSWTLVKRDGTVWNYGKLSATLPRDWSRLNASRAPLFLTKDGAALQRIEVASKNLKKEFPLSKKKLAADALPQEAADALVNELSLHKELFNFHVERNVPADVAGKKGFLLNYSFSTGDDIEYNTEAYGFINAGWFYLISFTATRQHYFDRDRPDFDRFVPSLRIKP